MTFCWDTFLQCHTLAMISKYEQYYNKSVISVYYAYAKNLSQSDINEKSKESLSVMSIFFILMCCIIILENLLVLAAVCRNKKFHSAMFFFIGNLAFSDLLAGSAYIANILLSGKRTFELVPVEWFIREGTAFITLAASIFSLLAIAIERFTAITKVKVYGSNKSCRMFFLIGACWVTSILIGCMPIIGWNCINNLSDCSFVLPLYSKRYIFFVVTIFTLILFSIVVLYVRIYLIVKSSHRETTASPTYALLKTVTIVLGVFIICWLPAFTILLLDVSCAKLSCPILSKSKYFFGFATLNCALNPVIYTLRSKDMRREFLRVICCWGLFHSGRSTDCCMIPLKGSTTLEHCTFKHEQPTTPIMQDCTTFV
ncbi:sphingosine 1-phosphate receptor 2 [Erpetoichthys calabaricus]|uniref:Sphingosine-1-phosphate receptor 2 n=1 Tax=Erpetoichthys calabaricus TaxID=27687 RepID=A0A8C4SZX8_ERPCA|nr:sphingosine 1-phosphate receptor 2 [Erpetoichthys calabaricus]XP_028678555.1 sphingosine 1-phosphate receptor 2 [Erpetoichthys calabaricus]